MAVSRRHCSTAVWGSPYCQNSREASANDLGDQGPITPENGLIRAEGIVLTCGRRVGTAEGRVTDTNGRLLAHGTTTCLIFPR
jgi:hypothetical protein